MNNPLEFDSTIVVAGRAGSGLYGRVWEADQSGRKVAVKVIHPEMRRVASALDHFRSLVKVDGHPHVVKVFAVAKIKVPEEAEPVEAVVMEWLEGTALDKRLKGPAFTTTEAKSLCSQILDGLGHMHAKGVAHGDLHAANVILTADGAKIIDVDVSKTHSLRALTLQSRELKISSDIDYARALVNQVLLHSRFDLEIRVRAKQELEDAESVAALRFSVAQWRDGEMAEPIRSHSTVASRKGARDQLVDLTALDTDPRVVRQRVSALIEQKKNISLRSVLVGQSARLAQAITSDEFSPHADANNAAFRERVARYEQLMSASMSALATMGYWGTGRQADYVKDSIEIVANIFYDLGARGGTNWWLDLDIYPAALLMYSAGLAATASSNFRILATILRDSSFLRFGRPRRRISSQVWQWKAEYTDHWNQVYESRRYTPVSGHFEECVRPHLIEWIPLQKKYEQEFDKFEFLGGLVEFKHSLAEERPGWGPKGWGPVGSFAWRGERSDDRIWNVLDDEVRQRKANWGGIRSGLFESVEEYDRLRDGFLEFVARVRHERGMY